MWTTLKRVSIYFLTAFACKERRIKSIHSCTFSTNTYKLSWFIHNERNIILLAISGIHSPITSPSLTDSNRAIVKTDDGIGKSIGNPSAPAYSE